MGEGDTVTGGSASGVGVHAMVQSGHWETPYRRTGRGHPVLLLLPGTLESRRSRVFAGLGETGLVIEPSWIPGREDRVRWLLELLDGLGLDRPDVVADAEGLETVRAILLQAPDALGRLLDIENIDP